MSETTREKAAFAEWLGRYHLKIDERLAQAVYLPTGAPADVVRLLEVNLGLFPTPDEPIRAIETIPSKFGLPFRVQIADITPEEWRQIQTNPALLPTGWHLDGYCIVQRVG